MKRFVVFVIIILFFLGNVFSAQTENITTQRFGIFIGSNNGGRERVMLRYAVTDARSILNVFLEMGGIESNDTVLLVEPNIREINNKIDAMHRQVVNAKSANKRTEIIFYYSGHSDEEGLLLNREKLMYRNLRDRINSIPSDMKIVILDSCASGAFTRLKGGEKTMPFLVDSSFTAEGYAFLTSSSANESSQESDRIAASYFTHSLVSGLRGAADTVGDGRVTLNELYRYAYTETLARTETSMHGTQHPSYDIQISGTGDLVLTDVSQNSAGILFNDNLAGRISIRNSRDHLVVEITKTVRPIELGLEPGSYRITLQQDTGLMQASVTLVEGRRTTVTKDNFISIDAEPTRRRGGEDILIPFLPEETSYNFFVNVLYSPFMSPAFGFINFGIGNHGTFHVGFINWTTDNFTGSQISFINTTGGDFNGFQTGFINTNIGDTKGMQVGYVNTNIGETKGMQVAFVNTSVNKMNGLQVGFVNVAVKEMTGLQIGFVNYAESIEKGIPIGFISIVKNGGYKAIEYSFSEFFKYSIGLKLGVDKFYTAIILSYNQADEASWNNFAYGMGFGSIFSLSRNFYLNSELMNTTTVNDVSNNVISINYSSFIFSAGINIGKLSIAAGPSVTWVTISNAESIQEHFTKSFDPDNSVKNALMPDPVFSLGTFDLNQFNRIVIGAKISARLKL